MAAPVARGPLTFLLQSTSGQYLVLGMGAYSLFPDQVKTVLRPVLSHPAIVATFGDLTAGISTGATSSTNSTTPNIIIHTPSPTILGGNNNNTSLKRSVTTVLVYSVAGAGACWVGYIVCSQLLPDAVSEFMPVTKRLFKETSKTLGNGILQVKELLESQITQLLGQQQLLQKQQDETHKSVQEVQDELGHARKDLANLQSSLDRCEVSLDNTQNMQSYTLKGIKLLVRAVTSFMPDESTYMDDIHRFVEEGGNGGSAPSLTATGQTRGGQANGSYRALPSTSTSRTTSTGTSQPSPRYQPITTPRNSHRTNNIAVTTTTTPTTAIPMIYPQHHQPYSMTPSSSATPSTTFAPSPSVAPKIYATSPAATGFAQPEIPPPVSSMDSDDLSSLGGSGGGSSGGMNEIRALLGQ